MKQLSLSGFLFLALVSAHSQSRFDIVYLADPPVVSDIQWLNRMKRDWHATAINLRISWHQIENANHYLDWNTVDRALHILDSANLGIYIRVSMNVINPEWYSDFTTDDFHQRYDGTFYLRPYWDLPERSYRRMLNFRSPRARSAQVSFFRMVVAHLSQSRYAKKIRLIVPTISVDDESEYPTHTLVNVNGKDTDVTMMSGYSLPELNAFVLFLLNRYGALTSLNASWGSGFSSLSQISQQMCTFGWHEQPNDPNHRFQFPNGRKDWLDFRARELKNFLDTLCLVTKSVNKKFRFGLQFGTFYDNLLLFRGFHDPTPLLEKVDFFITGEIAEYEPNFGFAANYSRTLARYWNWKNRRKPNNRTGFATESNWPSYGFNEQHPKGYTPDALCRTWEKQLESFHRNGASAHFVSLWGTTEAILYHFADSIKSGFYIRPDQYLDWSRTLSRYGRPRESVTYTRAIHLGTAQALMPGEEDKKLNYAFGEEVGVDTGFVSTKEGYRVLNFYEFPFRKYVQAANETEDPQSRESYDVVTDYMIERSPEFIASQYKELYFTRWTSDKTEKAVLNLKSTTLRNLKIKR